MVLIASVFGCILPESDFQQVGNRVGAEFFHDVGAVRFHRLDADAQVIGDLLVDVDRRSVVVFRSDGEVEAAKRATVLRSERDRRNSRSGSTMRGSGDHHRIGSPGPYQGKTPWR